MIFARYFYVKWAVLLRGLSHEHSIWYTHFGHWELSEAPMTCAHRLRR